MSWDNRVVWSEGTFLQPQHLQQHDRYLESYVELRSRDLRPYSWGFLEMTLDDSLLELGKLAIRSARGVLPDGTPFDCPARDPLPPPLTFPPRCGTPSSSWFFRYDGLAWMRPT